MSEFIQNWLISIPIFATPILLASIGLILTARAGVLNLGAEGIMAVAAMVGVMCLLLGIPLWAAFVLALASGCALSVVFAIAVVAFRTNQVLTGLLLGALGLGISGVAGHAITFQPITGFQKLRFGALTDVPWIGPIVFRQDFIVYLAAASVLAVWWFLYRTQTGLRLRAVGEDPHVADASGTNVSLYRFAAILVGGIFCAAGGAYLSMAAGEVWVEHMVGGRGWVAVALAIFARWRPFPAVGGAILFGGSEALIPRVQAAGIEFPSYVLLMLPYLITLLVLILPYLLFRHWKDEAPEGLLGNFVREDRH